MKVALSQDIMTTKKYIRDVKVCIGDTQEHVSKKINERVFQGIKYSIFLIKLYTCNNNL